MPSTMKDIIKVVKNDVRINFKEEEIFFIEFKKELIEKRPVETEELSTPTISSSPEKAKEEAADTKITLAE